jgi:radical SAM protein with 4Fe4S-binding SPASM domain
MPDMTYDKIQHIMEKVRPQFKGGRGIVFFGGEPLLRVDLIERCVKDYADGIPDGIGGVVTSATVNMDKFFPIYRDYQMDLQISYDGLLHNKSRHNKFDFGALQPYLELWDKRWQLRKTVSDCNIDTLFDDYLFGRELHLKYNASFDFSVAHQLEYSKDFWDKLYYHTSRIWDHIRFCIENEEQAYIPLTLMDSLNHVKRYLMGKPMERIDSCEVGHILVIEGNGDCFPCTMLSQCGDEFKIGNIYTEIDIDKAAEYACTLNCNCPYSIVCGGGCRWERYNKFGKEGMKTNKISSTCKLLHIRYTTALKFLESLDERHHDIIDVALRRFDKYQRLTFTNGLYKTAHKIAQKAVEEVQDYGMISWR